MHTINTKLSTHALMRLQERFEIRIDHLKFLNDNLSKGKVTKVNNELYIHFRKYNLAVPITKLDNLEFIAKSFLPNEMIKDYYSLDSTEVNVKWIL